MKIMQGSRDEFGRPIEPPEVETVTCSCGDEYPAEYLHDCDCGRKSCPTCRVFCSNCNHLGDVVCMTEDDETGLYFCNDECLNDYNQLHGE